MRSGFLTVKMSPILFFPQLNPRPMDILIPDTSSLINIHEVYVGRSHIVDVLNQLFTVQVSGSFSFTYLLYMREHFSAVGASCARDILNICERKPRSEPKTK